jgi:hypothetical protein
MFMLGVVCILMPVPSFRWNIMNLKLTLAIAAAIVAAPAAAAVTVGSPDGGYCYPFNCNESGTDVGQSIHFMQIYAASEFSGVTSFNKITFFAATNIGPAGVISGNYDISFHTTSASVGNAYPIGPLSNSASFFNGALSSPISANPFSIGGSTYIYNPADGNLVMSIVVTDQANVPVGSNGFFLADYTEVVTTRAYNLSNFTQIYGGGGLVTEFGVVPEPQSWALLIAGFGLTGMAMRRRVKAVAA